MDMWYWGVEYGKVLCGYLLLMFLWPSVVFNGYLKKKSKTFRFSFCVTAMIIIVNTIVLFLGLFHILDQWIVRLVFYGIFIFAFFKNTVLYFDSKYRMMMEQKFPDVRSLYGRYRVVVIVLTFFAVCYFYVKKATRWLTFEYLKKLKNCNWPKIRLRIKEHVWNSIHKVNYLFWKYGLLSIVIIYGMTYFSYGVFQVHCYGCGDLNTHHGWIYGLIEGNIFSAGVYPEAMHCFVYCISTLFGIRVYSILLFLQGIHVAVFLLSVYILLQKVFHWRYTAVFVIGLFLTLDLNNADLIHSMFRLQMTLPQEFGLYTVCLCAYYLVNYINDDRVYNKKGKASYYHNENLFLFVLSFAASITIHFHVVIMAIIICLSFVVFVLKKIFYKKYFIPLVMSTFCSLLIAIAPMLGALAQGIPFNYSISWAINTMSGEESRELRHLEENDNNEEINEDSEAKDMMRNEFSITAFIINFFIELYREGYVELYGVERARLIIVLTIGAVIFCRFAKGKSKLQFMQGMSADYFPIVLASALYVLVYAAPMIGLPDIIPEGRFFAIGHMMLLAVMLMPVDVIFSGLTCLCSEFILKGISLLTFAGVYGITVLMGNFRGFLFCELSRYNAAVMTTNRIIDTFPRHSYTIVSPTDELYPVIEYGWHEELLTFVEKCNSEEEYTLPSEYVFIFVEKWPLLYSQSFFFSGPSWMGEEKYLEPYWQTYSARYPNVGGASQSPEIISLQISEEEAMRELPQSSNSWGMYLHLDNRTVLESKAYDWCQEFAEANPSVLNIFYEDSNFICYYFRQDVGRSLYNLVLE